MKPMLPSLTFEAPERPEWLYEVKFDGFRAILDWSQESLQLISRNGKSLLSQFPEIQQFLKKHEKEFLPYLPLQLDGELAVLENQFKANFSEIQKRGRLKSKKRIMEQAKKFPCRLLIFDMLKIKGIPYTSNTYLERKAELATLFDSLHFEKGISTENDQLLQMIIPDKDFNNLWKKIVLFDGEGIVAKHRNGLWVEGKRSNKWLKYKNFKYFCGFITDLDKTNQYIGVGVFNGNAIQRVGHILFGLTPDEKQALYQTIRQNKQKEDDQYIYVQPAICMEVKYLELYENQLREPHFDRFRFDLSPQDCTYERFVNQQINLPAGLEISHPDKQLWKEADITKRDFIKYLRDFSPYLLPFLMDRALTVIRFPHGMFGEPFYQKNCPDYAPDFVRTITEDDIQYILCNSLETLIWLGNQLAIEFHIPFKTVNSKGPSEIVFDLDPPSTNAFPLAIKAALFIKEVLNELKLKSFIKTSGNKGLQIYIPLPENAFSFDETRLFTRFIADYLVSKDPESFTIERLKKNRGGKLYVDYVQHAEGKTIIAPFSLRGNTWAGVATPLFWDEVNEKLSIKDFHFHNALKRINELGDPFKDYFQVKEKQPFAPVLEFLKEN